MNTEIKFRGWISEDETMLYSDHDVDSDYMEIWGFNQNGATVRIQETKWREGGGEVYEETRYVDAQAEVMQFTNLQDKNENDIYQSDYLKDNEEIYLVCFGEWEYAGLEIIGWYCKNKLGSFPLSKADCEKMEVIGNFYENSELSDI